MSERLLRPEFSSPQEEAAHYRRLALQDRKTGLGSEYLLEEWEEYEYKPCERTYFFAFIDIKKFKMFNDQYGQSAGDSLITEFGASLNDLYREARSDVDKLGVERADPNARDVIVRIGGDEILICYDLDHFEGDALFDAINVIIGRLANYLLTDPITGETFSIRTVFELSTPKHPVEYKDIKNSLSVQMIDLKIYEEQQQATE